MQARPAKPPNFLKQGLLIILPALALAVFGLLSLRQDRLLADHEASEQAKTLATDLAQVFIPEALRVEVPSIETVKAFLAAPTKPDTDPLFFTAQNGYTLVACLVDRNGALIYPPPAAPLPAPQPLDPGNLSESQRTDWEAAQTAEFISHNSTNAIVAYRWFLDRKPPEPFAAVAAYRLGLLLKQQGQAELAQAQFQSLLDHSPEAVSDSGVPLRLLARVQLVGWSRTLNLPTMAQTWVGSSTNARALTNTEKYSFLRKQPGNARWTHSVNLFLAHPYAEVAGPLVSPVQRAAWLRSLCAEGVLKYPLLASRLLAGVITGDPSEDLIVEQWIKLCQAHAMARALQHQYQGVLGQTDAVVNPEFKTGWFRYRFHHAVYSQRYQGGYGGGLMAVNFTRQNNDEPWLAFPQASGAATWILAAPESALRRCIQQALGRRPQPAYFGVKVELAGTAITKVGAGTKELAVASAGISKGMTSPDLRVSVFLTDPKLFYGRQRARTVWFGALIGLSTITVLVGFVTAQRAFRRQQQLSEMKSNFVSSVSHELRAPIASVRLMAEELQDLGTNDPQKQRGYHRFIVEECRRLSALIENVLDFSRHEQGRKRYEFEPTDLCALVEATARLMAPYAAEKEVRVATAMPEQTVEAEVDGRAIQQVLVNLIDNAIKHSPSGETVTIGLEVVPCPAASQRPPGAGGTGVPPPGVAQTSESAVSRLSKAANHPGPDTPPIWKSAIRQVWKPALPTSLESVHERGVVLLWVEDRGEGIPPEDQERIFERFYRRGSELRRETQGVGLGLAIVKYVTEAHGGRVTVRSAVGQGSRFTVCLPQPAPAGQTTRDGR